MGKPQTGETDEPLGAAIDDMGLDTFAGLMRTLLEALAAMAEDDDWKGTTREAQPMRRRWSLEAFRERQRLREALRESETPAERERLFAELTELERAQRLVPVEDESDEE